MQGLTPDGRYVLFASTANNLVSNTNSGPASQFLAAYWNIYGHDRQSNVTQLVSANLDGELGNGDSIGASLSTNGALVVFESTANDLVAADTNGLSDVFVRHVTLGQTLLVSVSTNGGIGNGESRNPVMTPDGRFVAFVSSANNLVPNDTNGLADVFLRDLQLGVTHFVSAGAVRLMTAPIAISTVPEISSNGRYVAFHSSATNLLPHVRTLGELYLRDTVANVTHWVSTNARSLLLTHLGSTNGIFYNHAISADGRYVAFAGSLATGAVNSPALILRYDRETGVTDLVHTNGTGPRFSASTGILEDYSSLDISADGRFIAFVANTNGTAVTNVCVLRWDALTTAITPVSVTTNGTLGTNARYDWPNINPTGRFVSFVSTAINLVTNTPTYDFEFYLRDILLETTTLLSVTTNGAGAGVSQMFSPGFLSDDGQVAAFDSTGHGLVAHDLNQSSDVFVRDLTAGTTELISMRDSNLPSRTIGVLSAARSLSADGRYLAFASEADHLVPYDTNGVRDVFVRDLVSDTITLVSISTDGVSPANGASYEPSISGDGRYVAFTSWASNLVAGDAEQMRDVFVRDLWSGTTTNVSAMLGSFEFYGPQLDQAGQFLLFRSTSTQSPHLRHLQSTTIKHFQVNNPLGVMTPDGQFVVYATGNRAVVWSTALSADVWSGPNLPATPIALSISGNGQRVAASTPTTLVGYDVPTSNTWTIATGIFRPFPGLKFSHDGNLFVFATVSSLVAADTNILADVYLHDFETGQRQLISINPDQGVANGSSDSPDISADGRFITFRSTASNLTDGDTNIVSDVLLLDRNTGLLSCLSRARNEVDAADNRSHSPLFSATGRSILFHSWAENLDSHDFNHRGDLFAAHLIKAEIAADQNSATISWLVSPGLVYAVEYKDSLDAPTWQALTEPVNITGQLAQTTDSHPNAGQRWYRIVAQ